MTPHLREEHLAGYLYRTLNDTQRESLDSHLSGCPACRALLEEHRVIQRRIHYAIHETLSHAHPSDAMRFDPAALRSRRFRRIVALPTRLGQPSLAGIAIALLVVLLLVLPPLARRTTPAGLVAPVVEEGMIEVDGTRLFYRSVGRGAPLVFLHPAGYEHIIFRPHVDLLANEYRLIFFDQRGSGRSEAEGRDDEFTVEQLVADLEGLREALALESVSLLGNGSGAMLAMRYAIEHPDRVDSLILVGPIPPTWQLNEYVNNLVSAAADPASERALTDAHTRALAERTPEALAAFWRLAWRPLMADEAQLERVAMDVTDQTAAAHLEIYASFYRSLGFWDLTDELPRIQSPTLIIQGARDVVPLDIVEQLRDGIGGARLVVMERSGRMPFVEETDEFVRVVGDFVAEAVEEDE